MLGATQVAVAFRVVWLVCLPPGEPSNAKRRILFI